VYSFVTIVTELTWLQTVNCGRCEVLGVLCCTTRLSQAACCPWRHLKPENVFLPSPWQSRGRMWKRVDDLRAVCLWTRTSHTLHTNLLCKWRQPSLDCKLYFFNKCFLLSSVYVLLCVMYGQTDRQAGQKVHTPTCTLLIFHCVCSNSCCPHARSKFAKVARAT